MRLKWRTPRPKAPGNHGDEQEIYTATAKSHASRRRADPAKMKALRKIAAAVASDPARYHPAYPLTNEGRLWQIGGPRIRPE